MLPPSVGVSGSSKCADSLWRSFAWDRVLAHVSVVFGEALRVYSLAALLPIFHPSHSPDFRFTF